MYGISTKSLFDCLPKCPTIAFPKFSSPTIWCKNWCTTLSTKIVYVTKRIFSFLTFPCRWIYKTLFQRVGKDLATPNAKNFSATIAFDPSNSNLIDDIQKHLISALNTIAPEGSEVDLSQVDLSEESEDDSHLPINIIKNFATNCIEQLTQLHNTLGVSNIEMSITTKEKKITFTLIVPKSDITVIESLNLLFPKNQIEGITLKEETPWKTTKDKTKTLHTKEYVLSINSEENFFVEKIWTGKPLKISTDKQYPEIIKAIHKALISIWLNKWPTETPDSAAICDATTNLGQFYVNTTRISGENGLVQLTNDRRMIIWVSKTISLSDPEVLKNADFTSHGFTLNRIEDAASIKNPPKDRENYAAYELTPSEEIA